MKQEEENRTKATYDLKVINWLINFAKPFRRLFVLSLIFMIITAGLELLIPYLTKIAVDAYIFPSWREATFSDVEKDRRFGRQLERKYPSSIIQLNKDRYLIDLSAVSTEEKHNLEKLGMVTDERYLVIEPAKVDAERMSKINEIVKTHPDVIKPIGKFLIAGYSSLKELNEFELGILRSEEIRGVARLAIILFLSLFGVFLFSSLYTYFLNFSGQRIMHNIRVGIFSHILSLPQSFFDKNPVGRLSTRVTNDVNAINEMYTSVLVQFLKDVLVIFGVLILMFYLNRNLTVFILVLTIIVGVVGALFRMRLKTVYRNVRRTVAQLNAFVQESVRGIVLIKLYGKENKNFERFRDVNRENYKANMDQLWAFATFRPVIEFVSVFAVALILWYGGLSVMSLNLTLGALIAYLYYVRMLFRPIVELTERYNIFQSAIAASENLYDLSKIETEGRDIGRKEVNVNGELEFRNVWFAYNEGEWVLKDVSFMVGTGETVALVGLTGSGKTTIVNLILRFYDIQKGQILFDGVDIREYSPEFLRANISAVFQDLFLFGRSMTDGHSGNGEEFARAAGVDDLVESDGSFISSGEKQLVSIGQAFNKDVNFLILDEATSHIDAKIELMVRDEIKKGSKKRTTLIIGHRLSNVRDADKIIVIHKGEIYEIGTHNELLLKEGIYFNLYQLQSEIQRISAANDQAH
ncbi:MAG: ABC transporter ATP-binding protein [Deltaproteobacteria bacterium]|nr:ABC transporter ATP-binding protein [Deltaproteobacteria bacterium]